MSSIENLSAEDKQFIRTVFHEMRKSAQPFMDERSFVMSNPQLFAFLSNAPSAFAIAGDGAVDATEIAILERLAKVIDVKAYISLELMEMMSVAAEPENIMTNEEFNLRVGSELLFLARNADRFENSFIAALKAMLTFDYNPTADGSLTKSFNALMDNTIKHNSSKNKTAEAEKLSKFKEQIGI
jgi:hypothetical protein